MHPTRVPATLLMGIQFMPEPRLILHFMLNTRRLRAHGSEFRRQLIVWARV